MGEIYRLPYEQAFARIRADFLEMPCLRLNTADVAMFCGIDGATCEVVLTDLCRAGILSPRPDGTYTRRAIDIDSHEHGIRRRI